MRKKIYWRWKVDAKDGAPTWIPGWVVGYPADGLIELSHGEYASTSSIVSMSEIDMKEAKQ